MAKRKSQPRCIVIAGPNGAGKTTFARQYLPEDARVIHFVNADLIAGGLSPLKPELATINRTAHHDYWRKDRESQDASKRPSSELCCGSRAGLAPCGEGCAEDCAHVWHAAVRVGKREDRGDKAVTALDR